MRCVSRAVAAELPSTVRRASDRSRPARLENITLPFYTSLQSFVVIISSLRTMARTRTLFIAGALLKSSVMSYENTAVNQSYNATVLPPIQFSLANIHYAGSTMMQTSQ